jgi:hypothetical protein
VDQLKVVLEHRFWILSVLAVLIPPIGWYVSTGDMAAQTDIRTAKIKQKVKSIQDLTKDVAKVPNNDWIAGVTQVNTHLATRVDEMQKQLFDHQRPVMVWWPIVDKPLKEAQVKYRDDKPANPQAFANARRLFISRYGDMWRDDVYNIVDPFDMVTGLSPRGGPGKSLMHGSEWGCPDHQGTCRLLGAKADDHRAGVLGRPRRSLDVACPDASRSPRERGVDKYRRCADQETDLGHPSRRQCR